MKMLQNKPINIHTEPGYIAARDDASINAAMSGGKTGVYTSYEDGCKIKKIHVLSVEIGRGVLSHQGFMYRVYTPIRFDFTAANVGQKKYVAIFSSYKREAETKQKHEILFREGTSAEQPKMPSLIIGDAQKNDTTEDLIATILISAGEIEKIEMNAEDLSLTAEMIEEELTNKYDDKYSPNFSKGNGELPFFHVKMSETVLPKIQQQIISENVKPGIYSLIVEQGAIKSPNPRQILIGEVTVYPGRQVVRVTLYGIFEDKEAGVTNKKYEVFANLMNFPEIKKWSQYFGQVTTYSTTETTVHGNMDGDAHFIVE